MRIGGGKNLARSRRWHPGLIAFICALLVAYYGILRLRHGGGGNIRAIPEDVASFPPATIDLCDLGKSMPDDTPGNPAPGLGLLPGTRLVYEISMSQGVALSQTDEPNEPDEMAQSIELELRQRGQFVIEVYSLLSTNASDGWLISFTLPDIAIDSRLGSQQINPAMADMENELRDSRILAEINRSGRIGRMTAMSLTSAEAKSLWKTILAYWQVVLPDQADAMGWESQENDATGVYIASYEKSCNPGPVHVDKQKLRYVEISAQGLVGRLDAECHVQGKAIIRMDPYQVSIEGREHVNIPGPGKSAVEMVGAYSYRLLSAGADTAVTASAAMMQAVHAANTNWLRWTAETPRMSDAPMEISGDEVEAIMERLRIICQSSEVHGGRHVELADELIEAIRSSETEGVDAVMEAIAGEPMTGEYAATIIGVLGAAGTPAAQAALLEIITMADATVEVRSMALQSLVQATEPIPEIESVLADLISGGGELAEGAYLTLSAMADRLREADPVHSAAVMREVLDMGNAMIAEAPERVTLVLAAIANMGLAEVPSIVEEAIQSHDASLRELAIQSLQRIESEPAGRMIAEAVSDSDEMVRAAAVQLLGDTNRTAGFELLQDRVLADPAERVRIAALMSLVAWRSVDEESVLRVFREAMAQDYSLDVREVARTQIEILEAGSDLKLEN